MTSEMERDWLRSQSPLLSAFIFAGLLSLAVINTPAFATDGKPSSNDSIQYQKSKKGLFRAALTSITQAAPFNKMHHWHLKLIGRNGAAVSGARIEVTGTMADQPHPLPTAPRVTREIEKGHYLIEGVKFDRQGDWRLKLAIRTAHSQDVVFFKIPVDVTIWADWHDGWTKDERRVLKSLWIGSLPLLPPDPTNKFADSEQAADFGHRLFFDTRLSQNGSVACATCHIPNLAFTDGRKLARGIGTTKRNAPTIIGSAYSPWLFWDGRKDSLWSQALGPFENPIEHGMTRSKIIAIVRRDDDYRRRYRALFGALPKANDKAEINRAFANLGKAIAAYERKIMPGPTKFDKYVEAVLANRLPSPRDQLNMDEIAGLKVFISDNQGQCIRCHNGPMFTDFDFHNIGSHIVGENATERGRAAGIRLAISDPTNCRSRFNDDTQDASAEKIKSSCPELEFAKRDGIELLGAFKTPTLRYLAKTAPYMHAGQFQTLEDAIWQYRDVPPATLGQSELKRLIMSDAQFRQLEDFLKTLDGPIRAPAKYLRAPD